MFRGNLDFHMSSRLVTDPTIWPEMPHGSKARPGSQQCRDFLCLPLMAPESGADKTIRLPPTFPEGTTLRCPYPLNVVCPLPPFSLAICRWRNSNNSVAGQFPDCSPRKRIRKLGKLYSSPSFTGPRITHVPWMFCFFSPVLFFPIMTPL